MEFDAEAVEAEVRAAFDGYEAALGANDVDALTGYFWDSPKAVRLMTEGGLYGIDGDRRLPPGPRRLRHRARAVAGATSWRSAPTLRSRPREYRRIGSGRRGAQSQVWVRRPEGWRIASAHVSLAA